MNSSSSLHFAYLTLWLALSLRVKKTPTLQDRLQKALAPEKLWYEQIECLEAKGFGVG